MTALSQHLAVKRHGAGAEAPAIDWLKGLGEMEVAHGLVGRLTDASL